MFAAGLGVESVGVCEVGERSGIPRLGRDRHQTGEPRAAGEKVRGVGMSPERVEWHLWNWSVYATLAQQKFEEGKIAASYSSRASGGIGHAGSNDFDAMVTEADVRCYVVTDIIIGQLPMAQRLAVRHVHLEAVYGLRGGYEEHYAKATVAIGKALDRKGIA